ncbi:MAG TPA: hypothetical protein VKX16_09675 [Chloroflexota bacterium]|nr:hypothetical protein [Chloroflexota bacterium]
MVVIGFVLLIAGVVMNFQVLRRPYPGRNTAAEVMRTPPWLVSAALVLVGLALILFFH